MPAPPRNEILIQLDAPAPERVQHSNTVFRTSSNLTVHVSPCEGFEYSNQVSKYIENNSQESNTCTFCIRMNTPTTSNWSRRCLCSQDGDHFRKMNNILLLLLVLMNYGHAFNKYSAEVNLKDRLSLESAMEIRNLEKPFRMAKLNLLWSKAQIRLTEPKLKSLYSELKIHDKEELAWKKLKSDGMDKEGLKEAEIRKKLLGIMSTYGMLEHFEDVNDPAKLKQHKPYNGTSDEYINKSLFKDKKLKKLWDKAAQSGFIAEELQALKEEFDHHQDKLDEYYALLNEVHKDSKDTDGNTVDSNVDSFNEIQHQEVVNEDFHHKTNMLREKHRDIRDGYDRLYRLAAKGPKSKEFIEPKVQGLWKLATESNFTPDELESLRVELLHYENRLLKLRHLHAEAALGSERKANMEKNVEDKNGRVLLMEETIKKQARKIEKLHLDLETRIMQKHIEL